LKPSLGTKFFDLEITEDESIFILRSELVIDCFDVNFIKTHSIPLEKNFVELKTLLFDKEIYMIQYYESNQFKCIKINIPREEIQIEANSNIVESIKGNPILDLWHLGIIKFGPRVEDTDIIKGERLIGYYTDNKKMKKFKIIFKILKKLDKL
jgi:hypothetical protein